MCTFRPVLYNQPGLKISLYILLRPALAEALCFSPPLCFLPLLLELTSIFAKICPRFEGTPSIQVITKVSNFVLSSLIARLALAMLYKYSDLWVLFWEELYVVVFDLYAI